MSEIIFDKTFFERASKLHDMTKAKSLAIETIALSGVDDLVKTKARHAVAMSSSFSRFRNNLEKFAS